MKLRSELHNLIETSFKMHLKQSIGAKLPSNSSRGKRWIGVARQHYKFAQQNIFK
jgi:hypothetical protein